MSHTIKGILMVAAITSMLVVGATATMLPIMQNSFAHKKSAEDRQAEEGLPTGGLPVLFPGVPGGNTNTNTNTADSRSTSDAEAPNTNNIDNTALARQRQAQLACAVTLTCPESSTTITPTPPPTPTTATLTVTKHVTCNFTSPGCPAPSQFKITVATSNGSSTSFDGSESGTSLTFTPPFSVTYKTTESSLQDGGVVIATIPVGSGPGGIAFNPSNGDIYVTNTRSNSVSVLAPLTATFSSGCNGMINAGQAATCNITNTFGK
jgi:DNA-binding beta-propeller fold protein YncE